MGRLQLGDLSYGALVYDLGRSITRNEATSTSAMRVLAVLQGAWVARNDLPCNASAGKHDDNCLHRENEVQYSIRWLARQALGHYGGSQRHQVMSALAYLSGFGYRAHDDSRVVRPVLTLATSGGDPTAPKGVLAWHPRVLMELMAGHFQLVPMSLIRGLMGREAFRVWLHVLMKPGAARIGREGNFRDFAISGPNTFAIEDLHLSSLPPARLRRALEHHAGAGNAAQAEYRLDVLDRMCGGLKLRLTRPGASARAMPVRRRSPRTSRRQRAPAKAA